MKTKGFQSDALRKDLSRLIGGQKVKTEPENLLAYVSDASSCQTKGGEQTKGLTTADRGVYRFSQVDLSEND